MMKKHSEEIQAKLNDGISFFIPQKLTREKVDKAPLSLCSYEFSFRLTATLILLNQRNIIHAHLALRFSPVFGRFSLLCFQDFETH